MISPLDVSILDRNSEFLGIEVKDLMEAAGRSLAEEIEQRYPGKGEVIFLIGPGNNGGDVLVAARYLFKIGVMTRVILTRPPSRLGSHLSRKAFDDLPDSVERVLPPLSPIDEIIGGPAVIVDALLGAGSRGAPRGAVRELIDAVNGMKALKVAVDSPTGLGHPGPFQADATVTFHDMKEGMLEAGAPLPECGEIIIKDIGIPPEAARIIGPGDLLRYPIKGPCSHKGEMGKVLVIGGGPFVGAPVLAALAATRSGADLVRLMIPRGIADAAASYSTDIIPGRLDTLDPFSLGLEVLDDIEEAMDWCHAVLIGPGSGRSRNTLHFLRDAIGMAVEKGKKLVIDADGLTSLSEISPLRGCGDADVLLTPHRGEFEKLLSMISEGEPAYQPPTFSRESGIEWDGPSSSHMYELGKLSGASVLGKGPVDVVCTCGAHSLMDHISVDPEKVNMLARFNITGVPQMSVGGTGDILAGLSVGLMSLGMSSFDAGCLAAFINGRAGELSFGEVGHSLSASDVLSRVRILPP